MRSSAGRPAGALAFACFVTAAGAVGCAAHRDLPPGPALPEVRFVPPCDPEAAIALRAEDEQALVVRDRLLRERIEELESLLREDR